MDGIWTEITDEVIQGTTAAFRTIERDFDEPPGSRDASSVTIWEWAPGDMTRYTVIESKLRKQIDGVPFGEGVLISVLHPVQACALFMGSQQGDLHASYVADNLRLSEDQQTYTGQALTLMLGSILRRPAVVRTEWWEMARWGFWTPETVQAEQARRASA